MLHSVAVVGSRVGTEAHICSNELKKLNTDVNKTTSEKKLFLHSYFTYYMLNIHCATHMTLATDLRSLVLQGSGIP